MDVERSFQNLTDVYDSNMVILSSLPEIDQGISLKSTSLAVLNENKNGMRKYITVIEKYLSRNGGVSEDEYKKEKQVFHISVEKSKALNAKIEKFDTEFLVKYNIMDVELKKNGIE